MKRKCGDCGKKFVISKEIHKFLKRNLSEPCEANMCVKCSAWHAEVAYSQSYFQNMG